MIKPTPEQVEVYALSIDFKIKGSYFCDFYASKDWYVGKSPMKDWKAAVRVWKHNAPPEALVGKKYSSDLFERKEQEMEEIREAEFQRLERLRAGG